MGTCQHINFSAAQRIPKWVRDTFHAEYYYHESVLDKFLLVVDPKRFGGGFAWICKSCMSPTFVREEVAELTQKVVCRAVFCPFCWTAYRAPDTELMWVRILVDWDVPKPDVKPSRELRVLH